jgi:dihydroorotate dehydrogenase (NAD+) catalytic subunit
VADPDRLSLSLCGIRLQNPVIAASGNFGYGVEFARQLDLNSLGGIVVKVLSHEPIQGNPAPRIWETEGGMINSIGLQNVGVRAFVRDKLPALAKFGTAVFGNLYAGMFFSSDPSLLADVVSGVKSAVVVKLSPNVARIQPLAQAAEQAGAGAVSLVNTFLALAIDVRTRRPRIGAGFGGLSGPAIKPLALRMVYANYART